MAVKVIIPDPLELGLNRNYKKVAIGAGIQIAKGALVKAFAPPSVVEKAQKGDSYLNTPIMDNLVITAGKYTDLEGNEIDYDEVVINTVLFEVTLPKNIIKTQIQGRNGTVKEYVSDADFQINCRGMISQKTNAFPLFPVRDFKFAMEAPQQLKVTSQFLNQAFDIYDIVIESYNVSQTEGTRNEVPFTFTASSDVALGLEELA